MRATIAVAAAALLLAFAQSAVRANDSHFGVDDWNATHFSNYLQKDASLQVTAAAVEAFGLTGAALQLDNIDDAGIDWTVLGVKPEQVETAKKSLKKLLHRMNSAPVDFGSSHSAL